MTQPQTYQLPSLQGSMLYDAFKHLVAARTLFRDLAADNSVNHQAANICLHAASGITITIDRFKKIISKEDFEAFSTQVIESDPFPIENVKELMRNMNPEQQEAIEVLCNQIVCGEKIEVQLKIE